MNWKWRGVAPCVGVTATCSSVGCPPGLLMANVAIESWPRFETRTKAPEGSTAMRPHVLKTAGAGEGSVEMTCSSCSAGSSLPLWMRSAATAASKRKTETDEESSFTTYAVFFDLSNSMYRGPWGAESAGAQGSVPAGVRLHALRSNTYCRMRSMPRSGTNATLPNSGSRTIACACDSDCLFCRWSFREAARTGTGGSSSDTTGESAPFTSTAIAPRDPSQ
mmetsp:Transcript_20822/g.45265  ORF Transcript_20822/g.45265 Transcript_20822/m.45265 type:complete len:221 (+) Transcript_20822:1004-1666(+)